MGAQCVSVVLAAWDQFLVDLDRETRGWQVERVNQRQSGLLNKQEANLGSVKGSTVIGAVNTNTRVNRLSQSQSGLLNKQSMSIGSVD